MTTVAFSVLPRPVMHAHTLCELALCLPQTCTDARETCAAPQPRARADRDEAARLESRAALLGTMMGTLQKELDAEAAGRRSDRAHLVRARQLRN